MPGRYGSEGISGVEHNLKETRAGGQVPWANKQQPTCNSK